MEVSMVWRDPIQTTFASVLSPRLSGTGCHDGSRRRATGAVSEVIKWVRRFRDTGTVSPGKMGGHRPKKIAGAWRTWLLDRCRTAEFTLRGLVAELAEQGLKVDYRSVREFVHAEKLSHEKRR
jgi:putative transposase